LVKLPSSGRPLRFGGAVLLLECRDRGFELGRDRDAVDDPDLLPPPEEVAAEIVENLETALERFRRVTATLGRG
jgi:hypothetical protein